MFFNITQYLFRKLKQFNKLTRRVTLSPNCGVACENKNVFLFRTHHIVKRKCEYSKHLERCREKRNWCLFTLKKLSVEEIILFVHFHH